MQFPLAAGAVQERGPGRERRCRYRRPLHTLAYVNLGPENGGILRDVSDQGASLHTVLPLQAGAPVHLRCDLFYPGSTPSRVRLEADGQVVWADKSGPAGVRFTSLAPAARRQLNEWILSSLLTSITQSSPMLNAAGIGDAGENLQLSAGARAPIAIPVAPHVPRGHASDEDLLLDWVLTRFTPRALRTCVDALVLSAAVLLFLVVALAVAKALPEWPVALVIAAGAWIFSALLYRGLSSFFGIPTAGRWLAHIAERQWEATQAHPGARFR